MARPVRLGAQGVTALGIRCSAWLGCMVLISDKLKTNMKTTKLLELIIRSLPYPDQIRDIQMEDNAVRFVWRSQKFRVSTSLHAETIGCGVLIWDDTSILLEAMLRRSNLSA